MRTCISPTQINGGKHFRFTVLIRGWEQTQTLDGWCKHLISALSGRQNEGWLQTGHELQRAPLSPCNSVRFAWMAACWWWASLSEFGWLVFGSWLNRGRQLYKRLKGFPKWKEYMLEASVMMTQSSQSFCSPHNILSGTPPPVHTHGAPFASPLCPQNTSSSPFPRLCFQCFWIVCLNPLENVRELGFGPSPVQIVPGLCVLLWSAWIFFHGSV